MEHPNEWSARFMAVCEASIDVWEDSHALWAQAEQARDYSRILKAHTAQTRMEAKRLKRANRKLHKSLQSLQSPLPQPSRVRRASAG